MSLGTENKIEGNLHCYCLLADANREMRSVLSCPRAGFEITCVVPVSCVGSSTKLAQPRYVVLCL